MTVRTNSHITPPVHTAQDGFTLIELVVVLSIIAVLTVVGLPAVQKIQIEGRTPEVAKGLQGAIIKTINNRASGGDYSSASTGELASVLAGNTVLTVVTGNSPSVSHDLNKSGSAGSITLASGTIATAGDSGLLQLTAVDGEACTILTNALQKLVKEVRVGSTVLKDAATTYNGGTAQTSCAATGNTLKFNFS